MNSNEARSILSQVLGECRQKEYAYWERSISESPLVDTRDGLSGATYQLETDVVWDDRLARRIRVVISIDDGGLRAFFPMTDSFLVSPDGRPQDGG